MTLRQCVARELSRLSTDAELRASLDTNPDVLGLTVTHTVVVRSKEQADRMAAAAGIPTMWRNGYYMAAKEHGQVLVELHFAPLITSGESV
jgi:hypothetical protein